MIGESAYFLPPFLPGFFLGAFFLGAAMSVVYLLSSS
jgi:hypothetical protein